MQTKASRLKLLLMPDRRQSAIVCSSVRARFVPIGAEHTAALVWLFERNAGTEMFDPFPLTRQTALRIAKQPRADLYFGAEHDGSLLGITMLRGWDDGYELPSFGIMIDAEHRGEGLGSRMTELTLAEARAAGYPQVRLSVFGSNAVARALYERRGFVEVERAPRLVAGRRDERIVMTLDLAGPA
jgi:ribosomal-protein-alanine N-acetyltransferase